MALAADNTFDCLGGLSLPICIVLKPAALLVTLFVTLTIKSIDTAVGTVRDAFTLRCLVNNCHQLY